MATVWTSDHFRSDVYLEQGVTSSTSILLAGAQATLDLDRTHMTKPGLHARMRLVTARMVVATIGGTSGDIVRCFSLPSNSRVMTMSVASEGTSTNYVCDVGVYLAGQAHDGAVVDSNLYGAITPSTSITSEAGEFGLDIFETGALDAENRGDPLWHQMAVGGGSDTVDPVVDYDICSRKNTLRFQETRVILSQLRKMRPVRGVVRKEV